MEQCKIVNMYDLNETIAKEYMETAEYPLSLIHIWINQTPLCNINQKLWFFYGIEKMQYEADEKLSGQVLISVDRTWAKCAWRMKKYPNILFFSTLPILETENGIERCV